MAIEFIKVREEQIEKLNENFPMKNRVSEIYIDGDKIFFIEGQDNEMKTNQERYLERLEAQYRAMVNVANVMKNTGVSSYQAAEEMKRLNEALVWEKKQSELNRRTMDWNVQKDRVGKYKGYEVVRIDKKTYEELLDVNQIRADAFYVITNTNQVVYIDKVIGEFDFFNQDIRECEAYDYYPVKEVSSTTGEYDKYMGVVNDFFKDLIDPLVDMG